MKKAERPRPVMKNYFILDDRIGDVLGGIPVKEQDGNRVVSMTEEQAVYWKQQGAVGDKQPTKEHEGFLAQVHGRPVDQKVNAEHAKAKAARPQDVKQPRPPTASENRRTTVIDPRPEGMPTTRAERQSRE